MFGEPKTKTKSLLVVILVLSFNLIVESLYLIFIELFLLNGFIYYGFLRMSVKDESMLEYMKENFLSVALNIFSMIVSLAIFAIFINFYKKEISKELIERLKY